MNTRTLTRIRKSLALLAILSILSTLVVFAPVASAYTGADAPSWAKDAVDSACASGVVDCDLEPKFTETLNRAAAYQMLTKGFEVYNENSGTTFTDFDLDTDWFGYAAASAQTLEWTAGKDGEGVLFEGEKPMTRSMIAVAVSQVLGLEAAPDGTLDKYTDADDVPDWALDAVESMVNAKLLGQGGLTKLRPNDPVSKVESIVVLDSSVKKALDDEIDVLEVAAERMGVDAALVQEALDTGMFIVNGELVPPGEEPVVEGEPPVVEEEPPVVGALTAMLASDNPVPGAPLADGTAFNPLMKVKFMAGADGDVKINGIKVTRTGLTADSNVKFSVWDGSGMRHGPVVSVSDGISDVSFATDPITVVAGSDTVVTIAANIDAAAGSGSIGATVAADAVTSDAASVSGLPLAGGVFTTVDGSTSVAALRFDVRTLGTTTRNVDVGQKAFEVTRFELVETSSREDVEFMGFTLFNNGSTADADLVAITVYDQDNNPIGTVAQMTNKEVKFMFDKPYPLPKGTTRYFSVKADVAGGSTRTGQLIVQSDFDVMARGKTTRATVLPTATGNAIDTTFPIGDITTGNAGFNQITVNEGTLSISKDVTSPSGDITRGGTDVTVSVFKIEALGEDVQIERAAIDLSNGADRSTAGEDNATGQFDCRAASTGSNCDLTGSVKLVTEDGRTLLAQPATTAALWNNSPALVDLSSVYMVKAGEKKMLKIVASLASSATQLGDGESLTARLNSLRYKKLTSLRYATTAATAGNQVSATSSVLTVGVNTAYGAQTVVGGTASFKLGSFVIKAGSAEGVNLTSISVQVDDSGQGVAGGATDFTNLKLQYDDPNTTEVDIKSFGTTQASVTDTTNIQFSGTLSLEAGKQVIVEVYGDTASAFNDATTVAIIVVANGVSGNGKTSSTSPQGPATALTLQTVTSAASGRLTVTLSTDTPVSTQLVSGASAVPVMNIKLESNNAEDVYVKELTVRNDTNADDPAIGSLNLSVGTTDYGTVSFQGDGATNQGFVTWNFIGSGRPKIVSNGSLSLVVKMNVVSSQQTAVSNLTPQLRLANIRVEGVTQIAPANTNGNDLILNNLATSAGSPGMAFGTTNAANTFAADASATSLVAGVLTAATATLTANAAPTTDRTNGVMFIDQNDDATYDDGEELVYVLEGTGGDAVLTVVRAAFNTTAQAFDANDNIYFLVATSVIASNAHTVVNTKPTVAAATDSPTGASASAGTGVLIAKFTVAAANNAMDPAENKVTLRKFDIRVSKSGTQVTNLALYPATGGRDLNAVYLVTPVALSTNTYRFDIGADTDWAATGDDQIIENASKTYVLRGDVVVTTANGTVRAEFNNLGNSTTASLGAGDAGGDTEWSDGTTTFFWTDQGATQVFLNAASLTYAAVVGAADATAPLVSTLSFTDSDATANNLIGATSTILITYNEAMDPTTLVSGATTAPQPGGAAVAVTADTRGDLQINDGGGGNDILQIDGFFNIDMGATTPVAGAVDTATTTLSLNSLGTLVTIAMTAAPALAGADGAEIVSAGSHSITVRDANGVVAAATAANAATVTTIDF